jgi:outer membrane protein TolC
LKAQAFSSRSDLQALRLQSDAANDLLAGSRNRMKPKIDIDLWAGYRGQHKGSAIADYLSSIASEVPGLNVSATLRYMFATGNYSDEAALIRSRSLYEKSLISYLEMERSISGSVGLAAEAVKNTTDVYWLSMQSASTYRLLHAAELKKYRLGISDLFKTQAISTDLAHAEKQLLAVEQAYATSLLTLRYEIAALVHVQDGSYSVEQQDLVTLPLLNNTSNKP